MATTTMGFDGVVTTTGKGSDKVTVIDPINAQAHADLSDALRLLNTHPKAALAAAVDAVGEIAKAHGLNVPYLA